MSCIFCKILLNECPASKIYEDEHNLVFLDIFPLAEGHTLVIPRRHVVSFSDLETEEAARLLSLGRTVAAKMKQALTSCEGLNVYIADGESAGQEVPHVHLHLIPRQTGDGLGLKRPAGYGKTPEQREKLEEIVTQLRL